MPTNSNSVEDKLKPCHDFLIIRYATGFVVFALIRGSRPNWLTVNSFFFLVFFLPTSVQHYEAEDEFNALRKLHAIMEIQNQSKR